MSCLRDFVPVSCFGLHSGIWGSLKKSTLQRTAALTRTMDSGMERRITGTTVPRRMCGASTCATIWRLARETFIHNINFFFRKNVLECLCAIISISTRFRFSRLKHSNSWIVRHNSNAIDCNSPFLFSSTTRQPVIERLERARGFPPSHSPRGRASRSLQSLDYWLWKRKDAACSLLLHWIRKCIGYIR